MTELFSHNPEIFNETGFVGFPAVESLLDPALTAEMWPDEIATNEAVIEQADQRREVIKNLEAVLTRMPHPLQTVEEALSEGQLDAEQVENLYLSLSDLLEDEDYRRILLYLPFEFLPQKSWHSSNEFLQQAIDRFRVAYNSAWRELLTTHDVRANFVDGDVIEVEQREDDLPRVIKAAHLIPMLIQKGLFQMPEVIRLVEESDDPVLKSSITEAISVAADLGLVTEEDILQMKSSDDQILVNTANAIEVSAAGLAQSNEAAVETMDISLIHQEIEKARASTEAKMPADATEKRREWLRETGLQRETSKLSNTISTAILNGRFTAADTAEFLSPEADSECRGVLVEGVRKAIESSAAEDSEKAQALYSDFKETLDSIQAADDPQTKQLSAKMLRRLYGLGIVGVDQLEQHGIVIPKLGGPVSENIPLMGTELEKIGSEIIPTIEKTNLSSIIYPAVLIYGSRLKGYGDLNSDFDKGVFVRPGTEPTQSTGIEESLPDSIEFWLEEDGNSLKVHDFPTASDQHAPSYWTHLLFGGVWAGSKEVIRDLHQRLLTPYLYETGAQLHGRDVRDIWLEEMEIGALQYRLMHKGYERFAPSYGGIDTPNAEKIDGQSAFWDSGYRRTATELFARRVFLPKIPK